MLSNYLADVSFFTFILVYCWYIYDDNDDTARENAPSVYYRSNRKRKKSVCNFWSRNTEFFIILYILRTFLLAPVKSILLSDWYYICICICIYEVHTTAVQRITVYRVVIDHRERTFESTSKSKTKRENVRRKKKLLNIETANLRYIVTHGRLYMCIYICIYIYYFVYEYIMYIM